MTGTSAHRNETALTLEAAYQRAVFRRGLTPHYERPTLPADPLPPFLPDSERAQPGAKHAELQRIAGLSGDALRQFQLEQLTRAMGNASVAQRILDELPDRPTRRFC